MTTVFCHRADVGVLAGHYRVQGSGHVAWTSVSSLLSAITGEMPCPSVGYRPKGEPPPGSDRHPPHHLVNWMDLTKNSFWKVS